ncbi:MAG: hypothetical protein IPK50_03635 [Fibrobacterota bacterium]|nr:MAG: hypothetical protein IPK50_03635 [Fibrobacterota bacterium]
MRQASAPPSAGLAPDAETPLDADLVEWAHEAIPRSLGGKGNTLTTGESIELVLPHGLDVEVVVFDPRQGGAQIPAA